MFEQSRSGPIIRIRLQHGPVQAMDLEFCRAVTGLFEALARDESVGCVVLTGSGRAFSAGVDLKRLVAEPPSYVDAFLPALRGLFRTLWEFPRPLVAAINGPALAGGCVAASTADCRVIADGAPIGMPESRVGLPLPAEGIEIIRFVVRQQDFVRIIGRGEQWTGAAACAVGLADESVIAEHLESIAESRARDFLQTDPDVYSLGKRQLRFPATLAMEEHQRQFGGSVRALWQAESTRQQVRRFVAERLERKPPAGAPPRQSAD